MRIVYFISGCCLLAITSCNNSSTTTTSTTDTTKVQAKVVQTPKSHLSDAGTTLLMSMVTKYYGLKNALVATKAARADSAAQQLTIAATDLQSFLAKDTTGASAMKPYIDSIISHSKVVSALKDETCERQRLAFSTVSGAMYRLLVQAGLKNGGVYHEYCPMAFNEQGAFWLSDDAEIKNPYFGKKMLECGEVTDSL